MRVSKCRPLACSIRRFRQEPFTDEIAERSKTICVATLGNKPIELFQQASKFKQSALPPSDDPEKSLNNVTAMLPHFVAYWIYPDLGH
jgi:hypothetical protein